MNKSKMTLLKIQEFFYNYKKFAYLKQLFFLFFSQKMT